MRGAVRTARSAPALVITAVAAAPVLLVILVARIGTGRWLTGFVSFFSDEVDYWRETATFLVSGFGGGRYGWDEHPAPAAWSHFGPHGPIVELVYGLPGKLFGWSFSAPLYVNLAVFAAATLIALGIARPRPWVAVAVGVVLCTFWPLLLYLPSAMEEPINQAVAVVVAAGFARILTSGGGRRSWGLLLAVIVGASLLRVTWSLMLIPAAALLIRGRPRRDQALVMGAALVTIVVLFAFYGWTAAPYPPGIDYQIQHAPTLGAKLHRLWVNTRTNFETFLHLRTGDSTTLETVQRFELVATILALLGGGGWLLANRRRGRAIRSADRDFVVVALLMLVPLLVATIAVWQVSAFADFRALAPCFLVVLVLGVLVGGRIVRLCVAAVVAVNVGFVVSYAHLANAWNTLHVSPNTAAIAAAERVFQRSIRPAAADGVWCRTVLWDTNYPPPVVLGLPRQLGLMLVSDPPALSPPLRSGWVVLPPNTGSAALRAHLKPVASLLPYGQLFENRDAHCSTHGART